MEVTVCRKCKHHDCLVEVLHGHSDVSVRMVRCQKICHGPVVAVPIAGRLEWFERVRSVHELAALVRVTRKGHGDSVPKELRKRRVKKYSGRSPRI
jgi:hypothetical protein